MKLLLTFTMTSGEVFTQPISQFSSVSEASKVFAEMVRTPSAITVDDPGGGSRILSTRHVVSLLIEEQAP